EEVRKQWLHSEVELKKYKELLVKSDVAKAALEVKLKHARNQLDVEMKKRYKMEGDYQYLQRQMQLMCDILVHDSKSSAALNEEQKSLLAAFEQRGANVSTQRSSKRLSVIDESSYLSVCHSDISYDRTDDDLDLDTSVLKPLRSRARERRRTSMGPSVGAPVGKRGRGGTLMEEKKAEDKALLAAPDSGGQVHVGLGIPQDTSRTSGQNQRQTPTQALSLEGPTWGDAVSDQTSVWLPFDDTVAEPETEEQLEERTGKNFHHVFISKTVIRPETCSPCGKKIRFGRMALKCRNCRLVTHLECQRRVVLSCPSSSATGHSTQQILLEASAPVGHPRIPMLMVECVAEIERRGLTEKGLYRVPGGERLVKELRETFLQGKSPLMLEKVQDIHVVCGFLKDFLRKLKEPLITFRLHRRFMEASEVTYEDQRTSLLHQLISELPKVNRDTLAFLLLHLHKVMKSPHCQMNQNNLARVFGPTVVGHGMSEPSPTTIMRDTNTQLKVMCCLLSLPEAYWKRILASQRD
uniref:Si:ch1073-416j23.1 n=1 Tax=Tetraodon nigroviridis TaxID=99883 RepID=H3CDT8_TETNG